MCPTLYDPVDCSSPGSSVHGISQTRILEWVAISFSRGSSWPRDWICISCIGRQILYHWATREVWVFLLSLLLCSLIFLGAVIFFFFHLGKWYIKKEKKTTNITISNALEQKKLMNNLENIGTTDLVNKNMKFQKHTIIN